VSQRSCLLFVPLATSFEQLARRYLIMSDLALNSKAATAAVNKDVITAGNTATTMQQHMKKTAPTQTVMPRRKWPARWPRYERPDQTRMTSMLRALNKLVPHGKRSRSKSCSTEKLAKLLENTVKYARFIQETNQKESDAVLEAEPTDTSAALGSERYTVESPQASSSVSSESLLEREMELVEHGQLRSASSANTTQSSNDSGLAVWEDDALEDLTDALIRHVNECDDKENMPFF